MVIHRTCRVLLMKAHAIPLSRQNSSIFKPQTLMPSFGARKEQATGADRGNKPGAKRNTCDTSGCGVSLPPSPHLPEWMFSAKAPLPGDRWGPAVVSHVYHQPAGKTSLIPPSPSLPCLVLVRQRSLRMITPIGSGRINLHDTVSGTATGRFSEDPSPPPPPSYLARVKPPPGSRAEITLIPSS